MVSPLSLKFSIYPKTDSVRIAPVILGIVYFGIEENGMHFIMGSLYCL